MTTLGKTTVEDIDREPAFGLTPFPRLLHRSGSRLTGLYLSAMGSWTLIYGLPLVIGLIIARLLDRAENEPAIDSLTWWLLVISVGMMALRALLLWGGLKLTFTLIFQTSAWIKLRVLGRLLRRPSAQGPVRSTGDILNRLRDDTDEIGGLLEWTTDLIYRSVLLAVAVVVLATSDLYMTIPLVLLLGGLWASIFLKNRVAALQAETRVRQGRIGATIIDTITGIRDLRLSGGVDGRLHALEWRFAERRETQIRHQVYADLLSELFRNLVMIGTAVVLVTVSVRIASGDFTVGKLVLFLTYTTWLGQQMFFFGKILARYQGGKVSYGRLSEIATGDAPGETPDVGPLRELTVDGLTCAAREGAQAVSFTVRPGQLVAITGEVGSGKSTIIRSLLGLQPGVLGSVRWNGMDITGNQAWLSSPRVSYARQSPRFLRGAVRENLVLGAQDTTAEQIDQAMTAVRLRPGSAELPEGLGTRLESGEASSLSGGQRQRLALARMLCRPAQLYVVDDCDASLDGPTARAVWQNLRQHSQAAWVVVSHNADLLASADVVVTVARRPDESGVALPQGNVHSAHSIGTACSVELN